MIIAATVDAKSKEAFSNVKRDVGTLFNLLMRTQEQNALLQDELQTLMRMQKVHTHALKVLVNATQGFPKNVPKEVIVTRTVEPKLVASKLSTKVHKESCAFAKHINNENIQFFDNKVDALVKGYKTCVCVA